MDLKQANAVDSVIPDLVSNLFAIVATLIVHFGAIILLAPRVGIFGLAIFAYGAFIGNVYMKAQMSVKRELSKAKAPVLAHFGASIEGLMNGKAASVPSPQPPLKCSDAGNSLERILQYLVIEQEPKSSAKGKPPAHWPSSGALRVENLSASYSSDGPSVLHDLSFAVNPGERIGVVGRTGSGKSSLTLALLRLIPTEGKVWYDGLDTGSLNLENLREGVTIIPQVPELLSGTLRRNLDPFDQFGALRPSRAIVLLNHFVFSPHIDDATLNAALRDAGLFALQSSEDESRLTLDSGVARGGSNLSVGQRQIVALARAMVRQSKLLILDEATSAIDYKTDAIIQESLRTQLPKDVTVITVAHRLQTVMDADRIMVLDAGCIAEFDSPRALLATDANTNVEQGYFRALVDESADREALYAAAGVGAASSS
ncbi:hypothetical protein DXG03_007915 [Asterophora parasitica]|uniref:ABC transporter domain-containing protein n=1 Tax=Asterophora parasitica TaxID=117018 RepID=A0A9P7GCI1_9AGAR|nr:hypothetical protein DXG03_007915 [Asterophora parasitica]